MSSATPMAQNLAAGDRATQQLTRIWEDLLDVRPIDPNQNYFELGGDSLLAVQMFAQVESLFQIRLPVATLFEAPTIAELANIVTRETCDARWRQLVPIQPRGSRTPIFCMHGAGGNVLIYRELSKHLGEDQPFFGLQSQGLDGRSEPQEHIEDMASVYVQEIRRVQPNGPYFLGGYCFGGTIAYEVAQQFRAQGQKVALLALFDTLNWCKLPALGVTKKASLGIETVIFHGLNYLQLDGPGKKEFLSEKFRVLRHRLSEWQGTLSSKFGQNPNSTEVSLAVRGKIWKANDRAAMSYVPKPYPGTVTDFRPQRQYSVYNRSDLKWEKLAQGQRVVRLPVYPAGMMVEPFVKLLAEALKQSIDCAINS